YDPSIAATISPAGDTDSFTLNIDPGQTITVLVTPTSPTLQPAVELRDPSNAVIGTATAAAAGQKALLQTVPTATGGVYPTVGSGASSTVGGYTMQATLNAALENETHLAGVSDNTQATAQNLDASAVSLGGPASRLAVLGRADSPVTPDFYAFTLAAGDTATVAVQSLTGGAVEVRLLHSPPPTPAPGLPRAANLPP